MAALWTTLVDKVSWLLFEPAAPDRPGRALRFDTLLKIYKGIQFIGIVCYIIPWLYLLCWLTSIIICTSTLSRPFLSPAFCTLPGLQWPAPQDGNEAWRNLDASSTFTPDLQGLLVASTVLRDISLAFSAQARKMSKLEESGYSIKSALPQTVASMSEITGQRARTYDNFTNSLCLEMDSIADSFHTFHQIFEQVIAHQDYAAFSAGELIFIPLRPLAQLVNKHFHVDYLPPPQPSAFHARREVLYHFNRVFTQSKTALSRLLPALHQHSHSSLAYLLTSAVQDSTAQAEHLAALRGSILHRLSPLQRFEHDWFGKVPREMHTLDHYVALLDRSRARIEEMRVAEEGLKIYLGKLTDELTVLEQMFARTNTMDDWTPRRTLDQGQWAATSETSHDPCDSDSPPEVALAFVNCQVARFAALIAGSLDDGTDEWPRSWINEKNRARNAYLKKIGADPASVIQRVRRDHDQLKKGKKSMDETF